MEGPHQFGSYILIRRIAVGGMAEIYLAKAAGVAGFEKHLVLKVIHPKFANDPEFIEMLVQEAKLVVQLQHGNIAQVFDLGREGDRYYIAMEYLDGLDLFQLRRRLREAKTHMPVEVATHIVGEVCAALGYAHERRDDLGRPLGIIHRDISPQNVIVTYDGAVKVIDFGIAKARARAHTTGVGIIKGKFSYMSPEQARGDKLDHRSDIFAVGVLFYELLTGRMLYDGEGARDALRLAKAARFLPPSSHRPDLPREIERIVLKALTREREVRYQNAGEMHTELNRWLRKDAPGFGNHRLATYVREAGKLGNRRQLASLARKDYLIQPQKSILFDRSAVDATDEPRRRGDQATRQIRSAGEPPVVADEVPATAIPPETPEPDLSALASGEGLRSRVRLARKSLGLKNTGELATVDDVFSDLSELENDKTVDIFSAPTSVVHSPAIPTGEIYNPDLDPLEDLTPHTPAISAALSSRELARVSHGASAVPPSPSRPPAHEVPRPKPPMPLRATPPPAGDVPSTPDPKAKVSVPRAAVVASSRSAPSERAPRPTRPPPVVATSSVPKPPPRVSEARKPEPRPAHKPAERVRQSHRETVIHDTVSEPDDPLIASMRRRTRRLKLALAASVVLVLIAGGVLGLTVWNGGTGGAAADTGSLLLSSNPADAAIIIDGELFEARTPAQIDGLEPGRAYDIRVQYPGFLDGIADGLAVSAGQLLEVEIRLEREEHLVTRRSARIESIPSGAVIYIGGRAVAQTPHTLQDVDLGDGDTLEVTLRHNGSDHSFTLVWPPGETHVRHKEALPDL